MQPIPKQHITETIKYVLARNIDGRIDYFDVYKVKATWRNVPIVYFDKEEDALAEVAKWQSKVKARKKDLIVIQKKHYRGYEYSIWNGVINTYTRYDWSKEVFKTDNVVLLAVIKQYKDLIIDAGAKLLAHKESLVFYNKELEKLHYNNDLSDFLKDD